jgi:cyclophilin family peptidyl-prolyl cis-trans isomerase
VRVLPWVCGIVGLTIVTVNAQRAPAPAPDSPIMVIETAKGTIEIELFRADAPKSVDHVVTHIKRSFYRSQRIHRVVDSMVNFGDPQTRDMTKEKTWGMANTENPIGVAEISARKHTRGMVGLGHNGDPKLANSQMYIMKQSSPSLDGKYAIVGRVISGMAVVDKLAYADRLTNVTLKQAPAK